MSYQYKKSAILFELQQAIKKKAEKSQHKEVGNKILQSSMDRKKNPRLNLEKNSSKSKDDQKNIDHKTKAISLFSNENVNYIETKDLKKKKNESKQMQKLTSLINYAISSAEKAMKFINTNNFQAEFAVKLFKSDKENLQAQIKSIILEDVLDNELQEKSQKLLNPNTIMLQEENLQLKKQIALLEKQSQRNRLNLTHEDSNFLLELRELEIQKYKEALTRLKGNDFSKKLTDTIEKEIKYQNVQKKKGKSNQIDQLSKTFIVERNMLCKQIYQNEVQANQIRDFLLNKVKNLLCGKDLEKIDSTSPLSILQKFISVQTKRDRTASEVLKINQIKQQKEQLIQQVNVLKSKLQQISDHSSIKKENSNIHKKLRQILEEVFQEVKESLTFSDLSEMIREIINDYIELRRNFSQRLEKQKFLQKEVVDLKDQLQKLTIGQEELQQNIERLHKELRGKEDTITSIVQQRTKQLEHSQKMDERIIELSEIIEKYEKNDSYSEEIKQKYQNLLDSHTKLTERFYQLENTHCKNQIEEQIEINKVIEENYKEKSLLQQKIEQKIQQLTSASEKINQLQKQIVNMMIQKGSQEAFIDKQEQKNKIIEDYKEENLLLEQKVKDLHEQHLEETLKIKNQMDDKTSEVTSLLLSIEKLTSQLSEAKEFMERKSQKISELEEQKEQILQEIASKEKQQSQTEEKLQNCLLQIKNLQQKYDKSSLLENKAVQDLQDALASLKEKQSAQNAIINQLKRQSQNFKQIQQQYERQLNHSLQEIEVLTKEVNRVKKQRQQQSSLESNKLKDYYQRKNKKQLIDLQEQLNQQKEKELRQMLSKLENLQQKVEQYQEKEQIKEYQDTQKSKIITQQEEKIEGLMKRINTLNDQNTTKDQDIFQKQQRIKCLLEQKKFILQQEQQKCKKYEENFSMLKIELEKVQKQKKQMIQQKNINKLQQTQYCSLIKRILRGLIDLEQLGNTSEMGLGVLLQIGAKKVMEQRIRIREEQSNEKKKIQQKNSRENLPISPEEKSQQQQIVRSNASSELNQQSEVENFSLKQSKQSQKQNDLEDFGDYQSQHQNNSVISSDSKQRIQQNNLNDFQDYRSERMLSQQSKGIEFDEFQEEGMLDLSKSVASACERRNNKEKDFDDFMERGSDDLAKSMLSEIHKKSDGEKEEQGFDEFNDFQNDSQNLSVTSQNKIETQNKADFDEFGEVLSDNLDSSLYSNSEPNQ